MNIRKALMISFISFAFLVTGCSSKGIDSVQQIADEATCQKTMTKVQNNVNEIIGKDYKYVLENMGRPYCTTYYIDMDKVKDISNIEELNNIEKNIKLCFTSYNENDCFLMASPIINIKRVINLEYNVVIRFLQGN